MTSTSPHAFSIQPRAVIEIAAEVRTIVQADRGPWLILSVLSKPRDRSRIGLPLSLARTMMMFLRQHQIRPRYTNENDAWGRAMQFWHQAFDRNDRLDARDRSCREESRIPYSGNGQIDEYFWYLSQRLAQGVTNATMFAYL